MNDSLFYSIVKNLKTAKDKNGQRLNMFSLIISQDGKVFSHDFKKKNKLNDIRSISKPIVGLALGIAIEEGLELRGRKLTLETEIWPFFEKKINITNTNNLEKIKKIKLKHLLNHTIGYDIGLMFKRDINNRDEYSLLDYFFNFDIIYDPGEHFVYSNVGPYLISAMIQEELGINLSDWINRILFQKIDILEYQWKNYGKYCAASSGLKLTNDDLHKIGFILMHGGIYSGIQVVPKHWIEQMSKPQVETLTMYNQKSVFPKYAYGYYLWISHDGNYFCDGTDGQYLIILPKKEMVITTMADQSDMEPILECFKELL